jgi:hypothetical protein
VGVDTATPPVAHQCSRTSNLFILCYLLTMLQKSVIFYVRKTWLLCIWEVQTMLGSSPGPTTAVPPGAACAIPPAPTNNQYFIFIVLYHWRWCHLLRCLLGYSDIDILKSNFCASYMGNRKRILKLSYFFRNTCSAKNLKTTLLRSEKFFS